MKRVVIYSRNYFDNATNRREYMSQLYVKLGLNSFEGWKYIKSKDFLENRGQKLLRNYSHNLQHLFQDIYPNYPWNESYFERQSKRSKNCSLAFQQDFMQQLYNRLKLTSLSDWEKGLIRKLSRHGGSFLLKLYGNNKQLLLSTIYPHYTWSFPPPRFTSSINNYSYDHYFSRNNNNNHMGGDGRSSNNKKRQIVIEMIRKYSIEKKEDWYRLKATKLRTLFTILKAAYPTVHFSHPKFKLKNKKSSQRSLYLFLHLHIYHNSVILEDYQYPVRIKADDNRYDKTFEFDLFIPTMGIAFEYQGAQHYADIPNYMQSEVYSTNDKLKLQYATEKHIQLIRIPYWWEGSLSSLISTIKAQSRDRTLSFQCVL